MVTLPGGMSRQDWVPAAQPPPPQGATAGEWHVVTDPTGNRWEWFPAPAPRTFAAPPPYSPSFHATGQQSPGSWGSPSGNGPVAPRQQPNRKWAWVAGGVAAILVAAIVAGTVDGN